MTLEQLLRSAGERSGIVLALFIGLPVLTFLLRFVHGRHGASRDGWRQVYSVLIYLSCVPGMLAAVLTGYTLLFLRANLLTVNLLIYFLPIASMVATLLVIRRSVPFSAIPGFDRIQGLMALLGVSFLAALLLDRLRVWLLFRGSILWLLLLSLGIFLALKWGSRRLLGRG